MTGGKIETAVLSSTGALMILKVPIYPLAALKEKPSAVKVYLRLYF